MSFFSICLFNLEKDHTFYSGLSDPKRDALNENISWYLASLKVIYL